MPTTQAVEIDGQIIPADQAMAGIAAVMQSTDEAVSAVQGALAQPIGQALSDTQAVCDAVKKGLKKYTHAVQKAAAAGQNAVVDTLANYVRQAITDTGTTTAAVATTAATGGARIGSTLGAPPPAASCQPPYMMVTDWPNIPPFCALIQLQFQCIGADGHNPGYNLQALPPAGATYGGVSETNNFLGGGGSQQGIPPSFPSYSAAKAYLVQLSANCGTGAPPPPVAATWNIYYYCDPCADPNLVHNWHAQVAARNPGNPWVLFQGKGTNFADQASAQAALDAAGALLDNACQYAPGANANCGTLPVPSPQPTPTPAGTDQCIPVPVCDTGNYQPAPEGSHKSPAWYEDDWVNHRDEIINDLVSFGEAVVSFLSGATDGIVLAPTFHPTDSGDQPTWASGVILSVASAFTAIPQAVIDSYRTLLSSIVSMAQTVAGQFHSCDKAKVFKLAAGRGFIHFLTHSDPIEIFHIHIDMEPLDRYFEYAINAACFNKVPELGEIWESYKRGYTTRGQFLAVAAAHGLAIVDENSEPTALWGTYLAESEWITPEEYIQWARRQEPPIEDAQISTDLQQRYGFQVSDQADKRVLLYDELPTISDVLHFLQRNVFDAQYVADFDLMDGFDTRFWPRYGQGLRAIGVLEQTARDHYAAHWINPSIGQLAEMAQRLRPGRVDPSIQFQWTDFLRVLAEQDVAPFFRARLQAISFRTLPIRQLTQLVKAREVDEKELAQRWQDIGYSPEDAAKLAHALMIQGEQQRATQQRGFTPTVVAKLFPAGLMNRDEAIAALGPQGFTPDDVDTLIEVAVRLEKAKADDKKTIAAVQKYAELAVKAFEDGTVSAADTSTALAQAGYTPQGINVVLATAALKVKMEKIDAAIKAIRKAFLRGEVNSTEALTALSLAGVRPDSATDRVQRWQLELSVPRKSAARAQIIKWAESGIISVPNAEVRLINLGWTAQDVALSIAEIKQTIAQAEAKAAARSARQLAQADALLARAKTSLQKQYCRQFSPGKLKLWFSERIIDEANLKGKLNQCGYNAEYIADFIAEATVARDKKDAEATKKGAIGIEYTGPGAIT